MAKKNKTNDVDAFLQELEAINEEQGASSQRVRTVYDVMKTEAGKVYRGYILLSFNETTSPLGSESIVVRCVAPGNDGEPEANRRVKFYLSGYEKNDWERFISANNLVEEGEEGKNVYNFPVKVDFLRRMNESQKNPGRTFKSWHGILRDGDHEALREAIPEVPEEQTTTEPYTPPVPIEAEE